MHHWNIQLFTEDIITESLNTSILKELCKSFPQDRDYFAHNRGWHGSFPKYTLVALHDTRVLGHLAVVERIITVGGKPFLIGGVQNVFVTRDARGAGLSGELLREAVREMSARKYEYGILFCIKELQKVYAAYGWLPVSERKSIRQENATPHPLPPDNIAMYYPIHTQSFPHGDIDLCGNDW